MSGPRTPRRRTETGSRLSAASLLTAVVVAIGVGVAACGPATPTTAPSSDATASSESSRAPAALPTGWGGNTVFGIEAMGAADGQILAAINDLNKGIQDEDLGLIREAADGLSKLDVMLVNVDKIKDYPPMQSFATRYGDAIRAIVAAATALRTAIDAGDAGGITTNSQQLVSALGLYTGVQSELASWVEQSIAQRRLLLR